ncbi:MAG: site-2 protease family protein [Thaumarchaeota archaeon]|nr:site-2 protease family protein [Nitrososphaerota archaeon]MCL5317292.1 site-2 protease family protein [Nitrososphaerota archaeon]
MTIESAGTPSRYDELVATVKSLFEVTDQHMREDGSIEFEVGQTATLKKNFETLISRLKQQGYIGLLRRSGDHIVLRVGVVDNAEKKGRRIPIPYILFAVTIVTISIDGLLRTPSIPGYDLNKTVLLYTVAVMGIIGLHELGHKVASAKHGMRSSLPYFIPGVPTVLPTFGAFISTRDPPVNRDSLFDLGISGPLAGLAVTLVVGVVGALTSAVVPEGVAASIGAQNVKVDAFTDFVINLFANSPKGSVTILSPLAFAATLGFLITFLNLMPAWQLDGGHIAGAALTRTQHKVATYLSIIILFTLGFTVMALLVLVLSLQTPEAHPLDEVSQLSRGRRLLFVAVIALAIILYAATIMNNPFFALNLNL